MIGGSSLTFIQSIKIIPLILQAEKYEGGNINIYDKSNEIKKIINKDTEEEHWKPENGFERLFYTVIANIFLSIGLSFILCAVYLFLDDLRVEKGIFVGIVGYISFFVLPSLGLEPEIPGTLAAPLHDRQIWWIFTVIVSSVGFIIIFFNKNTFYKLLGVILILIPHIIGAPIPLQEGGTASQKMLYEFINAAYIANGLFWIILALTTMIIFKKLQIK